jgi:heterodisulfide reductase subunit C
VLARIIIGLAITAVCFAAAGRRFYWLSRLIRSGQPAPRRWQGFRKVSEAEVVEVAGQRKLLRWTVPGLAHFFTMWGFTVLMTTIIEAYGSLFQRSFHIPLIGQSNWLAFVEDFFATAVLVSLVVFTIIRIKNAPSRKDRSSRFYGSHLGAAWLVLFMISMVIITLLIYRGAQINTGHFPYGNSSWAFASQIVASWLHPLGTGVNSVLEAVFLLANIGVITGFLVFVSYSKHLHIFLAPINIGVSRRPRALGGLDKTPDMDMENVTEDTVFGVGKVEDFTWKQMLDFATCTECGRCQSVCPAWTTGKPLSPKLLIMGLRDNMFASADRLLSGEASGDVATLVPSTIDPDVLWSCTTCGSCVEQCPVDIEHVDAIIDMRRYEVLMESRFPSEASLLLRNMENQGDPWGLGSSKRTEWLGALDFDVPIIDGPIPDDIEYLYWVGCAGSLDERGRKQVRASRAPETLRGVWVTSTSFKRWPRPTSRRCTRWARRRSSPVVPTALTP